MAERKKIVATDMDVPDDIAKKVDGASKGRYALKHLDNLSDLEKEQVDILVLQSSPRVTARLFSDLPNLKVLQSMSAGVDFIDFSAIPPQVVVCSNAGAFGEPIAEHVLAMTLYFGRNLVRNHELVRGGTLEHPADGLFLRGKTIGIIGTGGIGRSVARVAKGFKMRTVGINTSGRPVENFDAVWGMDHLDDLLKQSDVVVIALPLNIKTRHLITAEKLGLMKEDCILVNVARGGIIAQDALYAHLKAHPRFRAGIDVWWRYPKKDEKFSLDFPFFDLPNFLASPHNADAVPEAARLGQEHAFENVARYLAGEPLGRVIDKADYHGLRPAPGD